MSDKKSFKARESVAEKNNQNEKALESWENEGGEISSLILLNEVNLIEKKSSRKNKIGRGVSKKVLKFRSAKPHSSDNPKVGFAIKNNLRKFAKKRFSKDYDSLPEREQKIVNHYSKRLLVSHDTNHEFETNLTFGQRLADRVAKFGGSWTFIIIFGVILLTWIILNSFLLARKNGSFDPYPYILLNLFLSMLAAIQAPVILMSQNRQSIKDRLDAAHDYEVNLKAELEIVGLHEKLDELRESKWAELITIQQKQIGLLTQLLNDRGIGTD